MAAQIRDCIGFESPFSAGTAVKRLAMHKAFPRVYTLSRRKMAGSKLQSTSKREIFGRAKAEKEGILCGFSLLITPDSLKKIRFEAVQSLICTAILPVRFVFRPVGVLMFTKARARDTLATESEGRT
ncbi:MAG: hypothetical protein J6X61_03220 [Clostridia bacterium]|nr:hypothetical protein [Clostridia bacterium]